MSGDVTRIDGTTQILMREIGRITDVALDRPEADGRVALLGHSMASDIIVRCAEEDPRVAATIAISMFSDAVTPTAPRNLLIISGAWETYLRQDALKNVRLAKPEANEGETLGDPAKDNGRRAAVAPHVEHVTVRRKRRRRCRTQRVLGRGTALHLRRDDRLRSDVYGCTKTF